jgi:hypothetical protein
MKKNIFLLFLLLHTKLFLAQTPSFGRAEVFKFFLIQMKVILQYGLRQKQKVG